jgi:hypothetical protein
MFHPDVQGAKIHFTKAALVEIPNKGVSTKSFIGVRLIFIDFSPPVGGSK